MVRSPRAFAILAFCLLTAVLFAGGGVFYVERVNRAREVRALSCARMLGLAASQYAQDHKDRYPDAGRWEQELTPYFDSRAGDIVHPPAPFGGTPRRFSLNPALSGKPMAQVAAPADIWMFYESVSRTPSASDDLDNWPDTKRDGGQVYAVVYGDGHCYSRPPSWKQGVEQHLLGL
jgi:hypothetical protein